MASIRKDVAIAVPAAKVWDAVRDFGALHTRLVPGFVLDTKLDGEARIVRFANGSTRASGRLRRRAPAAGVCRPQRAAEAAQRLRAGGRRR